jgi:hypothetical protein
LRVAEVFEADLQAPLIAGLLIQRQGSLEQRRGVARPAGELIA